jgi:hypothetical protein
MFIIETGFVPLEAITTQKILLNPFKSSSYADYARHALTFRSFALCPQNASMIFYASQNKQLFFFLPEKH